MEAEVFGEAARRILYAIARPPLAWLRAQAILRSYSLQYRLARRAFGERVDRLQAVTVRVHRPGHSDNALDLTRAYQALVERIATDMDRKLGDTANCRFF